MYSVAWSAEPKKWSSISLVITSSLSPKTIFMYNICSTMSFQRLRKVFSPPLPFFQTPNPSPYPTSRLLLSYQFLCLSFFPLFIQLLLLNSLHSRFSHVNWYFFTRSLFFPNPILHSVPSPDTVPSRFACSANFFRKREDVETEANNSFLVNRFTHFVKL